VRYLSVAARHERPQVRRLVESIHRHDDAASVTVLWADVDEAGQALEGAHTVGLRWLQGDLDELHLLAAAHRERFFKALLVPRALATALLDGPVAYLAPSVVLLGPLAELAAAGELVLVERFVIAPIGSPTWLATAPPVTTRALFAQTGAEDLVARWSQASELRAVEAYADDGPVVPPWWPNAETGWQAETLWHLTVDPRVVVAHDEGAGIAWWNLHERALDREGDRLTVRGGPVSFAILDVLDPLGADEPAGAPGLEAAFASIPPARVSLLVDAARGERNEDDDLTWRYDRFNDASEVPEVARRLVRRWLRVGEGERPPAPFGEDGDGAFVSWCNAPLSARTGVSRALDDILRYRLDVRSHFAEPRNRDEPALLEWARTLGVAEGMLPEAWAGTLEGRSATFDVEGSPGATVSGLLRSPIGVGSLARSVAGAIRRSDLEYALDSCESVAAIPPLLEPVDVGEPVHPVNVVVLQGDLLPSWFDSAGGMSDGRYTIAVWAWELEGYPADTGRWTSLVDEVWAISDFMAQGLRSQTDRPVHVYPYWTEEAAVPTALDRAALGIPDGPYALFCFDFNSGFERKNPLGVLDAFASAFPDGGGPTLVLKSVNGLSDLVHSLELDAACSRRRDVVRVEGFLPSEQVTALMAHAACYVSLHRAEGLGLTMLEAMRLGVPVVATRYSANLEFMDDDSALLVDAAAVEIPRSVRVYGGLGTWADPDTGQAAGHLARLFADPAFARALGERGRDRSATWVTPEQSATFVRERVLHGTTTALERPWSLARSVPGVLEPQAEAEAAPPDREAPTADEADSLAHRAGDRAVRSVGLERIDP
jgi:glycosyltransferase involved in cell wall biosynthesis